MSLRTPSASAIRKARARYDAGAALGEIAGDFGVTLATFRRWRLAWGWAARPRERGLARQQADDAAAQEASSDGAKSDEVASDEVASDEFASDDRPRLTRKDAATYNTPDLVVAVRQAVGVELMRLTAGDAPPGSSEARARALASLTRTLGILRALEEQIAGSGGDPSANDDPPPVDIAELRQELARRLHRLCTDRDGS